MPVIYDVTWIRDAAGRPQMFIGQMERLERTLVAKAWIAPDRDRKRCPYRLADVVEADHLTVAAMLRAAGAAFPHAVWDMTGRNWMARADGTLVLTDPISRFS